MAKALESAGWSTVQALLSSSFQGYGTSSLDKDASEIYELAKCLKRDFSSEGIVIVGHSTGSQDAVRYAKRYRDASDSAPLLGIVLQAGCSDREAAPVSEESLQRARDMVATGQ